MKRQEFKKYVFPEMKLKVYIKEAKTGKVVYENERDLVLYNFPYLLHVLFGYAHILKATTGVDVNVKPSDLGSVGTVIIALGSGTTSPTESDYALENSIVEIPASIEFVEQADRYILRIEGTWTPESDVNVCEQGLIVPIGAYKFLIARDTFTCITLLAGVQYTAGYEYVISK